MIRGGDWSQGFTIIEVMIVIAVTALLFFSAVILVSGRQGQTNFQVSLNDIRAQVQQYIGYVNDGYNQSFANYVNCSETAVTPIEPVLTLGGTIGTNSPCLFLGNALHFYVNNTNVPDYTYYTVLGLRCSNTAAYPPLCNPLQSLYQASPVVFAPGTGSGTLAYNKNYPTGQYQNYPLDDGLIVLKMGYCSSTCTSPFNGTTTTDSVMFLSNPNPTFSGGQIISGETDLDMYVYQPAPPPDLASGLDSTAIADALDTTLQNSASTPVGEVDICFSSGSSDQSGILQILSGSGQLTTNLIVKDGDSTC